MRKPQTNHWSRHLQIGENQPHIVSIFEYRYGLIGIARLQTEEAGSFNYMDSCRPYHRFVLHDKYCECERHGPNPPSGNMLERLPAPKGY
jgi:hypothetical protein